MIQKASTRQITAYSFNCSNLSFTEQTAARREGNQIAREGNQQQMQLAVMQMQDNADQRIAELEYQKSRDRKEDLQYNERMEELDRKDRRAMMQNMAMGLASLGAAFAL